MKVHRDVEDEGLLDRGDEKTESKAESNNEQAKEEVAQQQQQQQQEEQQGSNLQQQGQGDAMDTDDAELQAALQLSMQPDRPPADAGIGLPDDFQGLYEIFGVV